MFSRITASNLFSWETLDYEVQTGISQITGFNYDDNTSEGSGKSSIPNILCWTLYGAIPKDAKIDEVVREGQTSGFGHVLLESGHEIYRSRKPNTLKIVTPEGEVVAGKDAKETQQLINKLIGLDFDSFCQSVYFAQNYPRRFVSSSETEKAAILSQIQDLTMFDKARKKVQEEVKKLESLRDLQIREYEKTTFQKNAFETNARLLGEQIEIFEAQKQSQLGSLNTQLKALNQEIESNVVPNVDKDELKKQLVEVESKQEELDASKVEFMTQLRMADSIKAEQIQKQKSVEQSEKNLARAVLRLKAFDNQSSDCPTCGQALPAHKKEHVEKERAQAQDEVKSLEADLISLKEDFKKANKPVSTAEATKALAAIEAQKKANADSRKAILDQARAIDNAAIKQQQLAKRLESLLSQIETVELSNCDHQVNQMLDLDSKINDLEAKLATFKAAKDSLVLQISRYEILKTGFKEVKQYVFQSLLTELSTKATSLASELFEVPISIKFLNEDSEGSLSKINTVVKLDGKERSLGLFSGGQYRRIELAVDLAMASIVANRSSSPIKFRILDEPMKDLSEPSMQKVVKLLEKLDGSTVIIEHNSITKSIIHNTFEIEYRNGISRNASKTLEMPTLQSRTNDVQKRA